MLHQRERKTSEGSAKADASPDQAKSGGQPVEGPAAPLLALMGPIGLCRDTQDPRVPCVRCGKLCRVPHRARAYRPKYCSVECLRSRRPTELGVKTRCCSECGAHLPVGSPNASKYCSSACRDVAGDRGRRLALVARGLPVDCGRCGRPIEMGRLKRQGGRTRYCKDCERPAARERVARNRAERQQAPVPCELCAKDVPQERLCWTRAGELRESARFCSVECQRSHLVALNGPVLELAPGKVGAIQELWVSADLLRLGYEVFRSVSQCASCDLVAMRNGLLFRVEVRTVRRELSGQLSSALTRADEGRYDVAALVEGNGRIHYVGLPDGQRPQ